MHRLIVPALALGLALPLAGCRNSCSNLASSAALKWDIVAQSAEQAAGMMEVAESGLAAQAAAGGVGATTGAGSAAPLREAAETARAAAQAARAGDWDAVRTAAEAEPAGGLELDWGEAARLSEQALAACAP